MKDHHELHLALLAIIFLLPSTGFSQELKVKGTRVTGPYEVIRGLVGLEVTPEAEKMLKKYPSEYGLRVVTPYGKAIKVETRISYKERVEEPVYGMLNAAEAAVFEAGKKAWVDDPPLNRPDFKFAGIVLKPLSVKATTENSEHSDFKSEHQLQLTGYVVELVKLGPKILPRTSANDK